MLIARLARTTASLTTTPIRYNEHLLDHLHFANYIWGDLSYYDSVRDSVYTTFST